MTSFVVLQHDGETTAKASEKNVFVRDAFSIFALVFPILWLFWHRLWIAGGCVLILFVAVSAFVDQNGSFLWLLMVFNILLSLAVAIEGSAWRMAALRLSGYKDRAIIEAENSEQAQLKWALREPYYEPISMRKALVPLQSNYDDDLIFSANGQS